jgi:hypothetical protein
MGAGPEAVVLPSAARARPARPAHGPAPVGYASSQFDAELMAGYLRSNGIKAAVSADDEGGLAPNLQLGGRVRVLVPRHQHGTARKLLNERK